jgi:hypothetical protein
MQDGNPTCQGLADAMHQQEGLGASEGELSARFSILIDDHLGLCVIPILA